MPACTRFAALVVLLLCALAPASARRGADDPTGSEDHPTCAAVTCAPATHCERRRGRATCVTDDASNPAACDSLACPLGKRCVVEKGRARCRSVCRRVRCGAGQKCVTGPDNAATCVNMGVNACAFLICALPTVCLVEAGDDSASCHMPATCADATCPVGTICKEEPGDDSVKCITACAAVRCNRGRKCVIQAGKPVCSPRARFF
ncbi:hypothetical protein ABPG75_005981 [Micractinium tetrahymenae]